MADRFASRLSITGLAPGATTTVSHNIVVNDAATAPQEVYPDRATAIAVQTVTATQITFINNGTADATAVFIARFNHSIDNTPADITPYNYWRGLADSGVSTPFAESILAFSTVILGNDPTDTIFDQTVSIPANFLRAGSVVSVSGQVVVDIGAADAAAQFICRPVIGGIDDWSGVPTITAPAGPVIREVNFNFQFPFLTVGNPGSWHTPFMFIDYPRAAPIVAAVRVQQP